MLSKAVVKARPSVLWCYKKELGFTSHRKKRMRQIKKQIQRGLLDPEKDDPFELFISATDINYCYYKETARVLGNTFGMLVLQDFEAVTPNVLARTVETVEGGGIVVLLLKSISSLKQLYTMSMDAHARFRTEAHADVLPRFNERFILARRLRLLPRPRRRAQRLPSRATRAPSSRLAARAAATTTRRGGGERERAVVARLGELRALKESLRDTQPIGSIINKVATVDQAKACLPLWRPPPTNAPLDGRAHGGARRVGGARPRPRRRRRLRLRQHLRHVADARESADALRLRAQGLRRARV